jgi:hypothetical protein
LKFFKKQQTLSNSFETFQTSRKVVSWEKSLKKKQNVEPREKRSVVNKVPKSNAQTLGISIGPVLNGARCCLKNKNTLSFARR